MKINIEALGHDNQTKLVAFYREKLAHKYGHYNFIHTINVKIEKIGQDFEIGMQIDPEKGAPMYAKDTKPREDSALEGVIKKINSQLERYKEKHYHSSHLHRGKI